MLNFMMLGKLWNFKMYTELQEPTIDDLFMMAIEEQAKELEVTVDYYMDEFM